MANVTLARSIVITLGKAQNYGLDAASYAQARLELLQKMPGARVISTRSVTICDGRQGWIFAVTRSGSDEMMEQIFAQGIDSMYVATLRYPKATGDLHAGKALFSLCPAPPPAQTAAQNGPLPFMLPQHWSSGNTSLVSVAPPVLALGLWLHPAIASRFVESLNLFEAPPLDDGVTPQQYAEGMLSEMQTRFSGFQLKTSSAQPLCNGTVNGWFSAFKGTNDAQAVDIEQMTAYAKDHIYTLQYVRRAGSAEDPQARKALLSLCPSAVP
jgi:hypothetical protein